MAENISRAKPSAKPIEHPHISNFTNWSVAKILRAIDAHEDGDFSSSALLVDHYGRDERITACTEDRISALTGEDSAPFMFLPSDTDINKSEKEIELLNKFWHSLVTDNWLRATLSDGVHLGFSISYIQWKLDSEEWRPFKLQHIHGSCVRWDIQKECYVVRTETDGEIDVRENDPNWFIYTPNGERSWMKGAVRSLGLHFIMRSWDFRDWARYNERHGLPIMKIIEPSGSQDKEQKDAFFSALRRMGSSGVIRLPQGEGDGNKYDVNLLEATSKSYGAFGDFLDKLNSAISIRILGQNLSTEISGGSYAAAGWHMKVKQSLIRGDATSISDALRKAIVVPYGIFNIESFCEDFAPWPKWDLRIPEDLSTKATAISTAANALTALTNSGLRVDLKAFAEKFDIPLIEDEE